MKKTALSFAAIVTTLILTSVSMATGVALAESQLDQQQTSSIGSAPIDRWGWLTGQTFTAGVSGKLEKVSIYAGCCSNRDEILAPGRPPGDLVVKIHAVNGATGYPNDMVLGSGTAPATSFPNDGSLAWVDVTLSQAPGVEAGKKYAIVLSSTGNGYDRWEWYAWGRNYPDAYAGGMMVNATSKSEGATCPTLLSGWNWGPRRYEDTGFKTFVEPGTPAPPPDDTTAPNTCIFSGPSGLVNDDTPTFNFNGSDNLTARPDLLYSYKVDGGEWSAFSSEKSVTLGGASGLSDGAHTFHLKAKDEAGNEDASPIERNFTVDATVPTVESVEPANGARGVPRGTDVEVAFSEAMDPCFIDYPYFALYKWNRDKGKWQLVPSAVSTWLPDVGCEPSPTTATLDPYGSESSRLLAKDTKHRVMLTSMIRDPAGNRLAEDHVWYFRTKGR